MDFSKALTFPFKEPNWIVKGIVGGLMMLLGIFIPIIPLGYQIRTARGVIRRQRDVIPDTAEISQVAVDGTMAFVAALIYSLPVLPFVCVLMFSGGVLGNSDLGAMLLFCVTACVGAFILLLGLPLLALFWMGAIRYCQTGNFSSYLEFRSLWDDVRVNQGTLLLLLAYSLAFGLIFSLVAPFVAATCIGLPLLLFYGQLVSGHLLGQAGRLVIESGRF